MKLKARTLEAVMKAYRKTKRPIWKAVYKMLDVPVRRERRVNVSKLNRVVPEGATVIIPGKVLGGGIITKRMTVVALDFSKKAIEKIRGAGGEAILLSAFVEKIENIKKKGLMIIGG